ncbi:MAG: type II secretion system protein [Kiritimatiellia bacterium]
MNSTPTTKQRHPGHQPLCTTSGFTLIELLAVITLIAMLMAMIFGAAQLVIRSTKNQRASVSAKALEVAIQNYRTVYGQWPVASTLVGSITASVLNISGPVNWQVFDMLRSSSNDTRNPYNTNNVPFIDNSTVFALSTSGLTPRHRLPADSAISGLVEAEHPIVYQPGSGGIGYYSIRFEFELERVTVSP